MRQSPGAAASSGALDPQKQEFAVDKQPRRFEVMAHALDVLMEEHGLRVLFLTNEVREGEAFDDAASQKVRA